MIDHKEIPLSQGLVALVDADDYERLSQWKWCAYRNRNVVYAVRRERGKKGKNSFIWMHREIVNPGTGLLCDHINGNGLDNRRCNLRAVSNSENCKNRHFGRKAIDRVAKRPFLNNPCSEGLSNRPFKGAYYHKRYNHWRAIIKVRGILIQIGTYNNFEDAHAAFLSAKQKYTENSVF